MEHPFQSSLKCERTEKTASENFINIFTALLLFISFINIFLYLFSLITNYTLLKDQNLCYFNIFYLVFSIIFLAINEEKYIKKEAKIHEEEINQSQYEIFFMKNNSQKKKNKKKLKYALKQALETRKFEIELYWKRAAYFWTITSVTLAGYFSFFMQKSKDSHQEKDNIEFILFTIGCIGFLFSIAWLQANRGSKQWQENWENHVDMLETSIMGPLYKTVLKRSPENQNFLDKYITGTAEVSVSKINQFISLFTVLIWSYLIFFSFEIKNFCCSNILNIKYYLVLISTLLFTYFILKKTGTYKNEKVFIASQRASQIKKTF